jgi:hypothetical protein
MRMLINQALLQKLDVVRQASCFLGHVYVVSLPERADGLVGEGTSGHSVVFFHCGCSMVAASAA